MKVLKLEAEQKLEEFENELHNINERIPKIQQRVFPFIATSMIAIPFGLGYSIFKKSSRTIKTNFMPSLVNEALMLFLGKWMTQALRNK
jgi:hypothetical protein